jgi:hypothetical protein
MKESYDVSSQAISFVQVKILFHFVEINVAVMRVHACVGRTEKFSKKSLIGTSDFLEKPSRGVLKVSRSLDLIFSNALDFNFAER